MILFKSFVRPFNRSGDGLDPTPFFNKLWVEGDNCAHTKAEIRSWCACNRVARPSGSLKSLTETNGKSLVGIACTVLFVMVRFSTAPPERVRIGPRMQRSMV